MYDLIIQVIIFGTVQGSIYALLATGFSLVYGAGGILNLSQGALYVLTGYMIYWFISYVNFPINIVLAILIITLLGGILYIILIKPLQESEISLVIVTFSIAFFLEELIKVIEGDAKYKIMPDLVPSDWVINIFDLTIPVINIIIIIASLSIVSLFIIFIKFSKLGKSIRAVSQDREAAMLMGINANRILMYTFMIASFLSGTAAFLYLHILAPHYGWHALTTSFSIVILGGLGSLFGSLVASFLLGYVLYYTFYFIDPAISALVPIIIIIIVLIIRPQGLFGKKEIQ